MFIGLLSVGDVSVGLIFGRATVQIPLETILRLLMYLTAILPFSFCCETKSIIRNSLKNGFEQSSFFKKNPVEIILGDFTLLDLTSSSVR